MNDKLEDIKLTVKSDRRVWFAAGFIGLCVLFVLATSKPDRPSSNLVIEPPSDSRLDPSEAYKDKLTTFQQDLKNISKVVSQNSKVLERMHSDSEQREKQITAIFESLADRMEALDRQVEDLENRPVNVAAPMPLPSEQSDMGGSAQAEPFGFDSPGPPPPPPAPPVIEKIKVLTAGDSVRVKLLTGVAAPVDGTPYPVMFKLGGTITGPDGSDLDVGEARILAMATGSETDSRVIYRLKELTMRHPDGRRSVVSVDGWIVGEDGIRGMKGQLVDRLPDVMAAVATASGVATLTDLVDRRGQRISVRNSENITVDGSDVKAAGASALNNAAQVLISTILERYENLVPVVEVNSGRQVVAVFSQSVEIARMPEGHSSEEIYNVSSVMD